MANRVVRRVVTGHDALGRAIIQQDGPVGSILIGGESGPLFHEVWNTRETPALIDAKWEEPLAQGVVPSAPRNGTSVRVLDIPPDLARSKRDDDEARANTSEHANEGLRDVVHSVMHRTETIDYGIIIEGELTLLVDEGETVLRVGDIVVQRGTKHAWQNRSTRNCRVIFILVDGVFTDDLRSTF